MVMAEVENLDDEDLEEDSEWSDSSSSEEEDLAGNNSGNPDVSKPKQPKNREQLNIAEFEKSGEQEDIVAEKINEPGGRFVNYFSASHRIPKALDVMRAKGNVIPLSEICRMYLGINRDMVAVPVSKRKVNIMPETKVSGKESRDTRRERNKTGSNTRIKKSGSTTRLKKSCLMTSY